MRFRIRSARVTGGIECSRANGSTGVGPRFFNRDGAIMNEILELATKLGKMMAADPRAVAMAASRRSLEESLPDRQLLSEYESQQQKIAGLEADGKPIEPEDKRKLADLHGKVVGSEVIKKLIKAQTGYVELMSVVSRRIEEQAMVPTESA